MVADSHEESGYVQYFFFLCFVIQYPHTGYCLAVAHNLLRVGIIYNLDVRGVLNPAHHRFRRPELAAAHQHIHLTA